MLDQVDTVVAGNGYSNGQGPAPSYEAVCGGNTGYAEVVRVEFDPAEVSLRELLEVFFTIHDPTTLNRQGNDVGTQYRTAIFPHSPEQEAEARAAIERAQPDWPAKIVTTIEPDAPWYEAEDYHQEYFAREGMSNGYCVMVVAPKLAKFRKSYANRLKESAKV